MSHWLEPVLGEHAVSLPIELIAIAASFVIGLFGLTMAYARYSSNEEWPRRFAQPLEIFLPFVERKWYVDELYTAYIVNPLRAAGEWFAQVFDRGVIDWTVNAVGSFSMSLSDPLRKLQNGHVPTYALSILVGVVAVVSYFVL
jgi:NADH-quinone oxidoreductase subunit L